MDTPSEFMNWRAGEKYRNLVEKIRQKKNLSSNSEVIRLALESLAKREKIEA
jgi:Arc/MetJ-type ribon-helix-helix transcriptional regulator